MRLVDADKVVENIDEWLDSVGYPTVGKGLSYYGELIGCVDETPTITPSGWVCVKDRLPNFGKLVIATDGTNYGIAWFCSDCTWMAKIGYKSQSWFGRKVTHWMPIPELPNIRLPEGEANGK